MRPGGRLALAGLCLAMLGGCDMLGIETGAQSAARKEAEGRAIGAACRHAGRAIEDCYALNAKADKAAIFAGWREMNDYMGENKIEEVKPVVAPSQPVAPPPPKASAPARAAEDEEEEVEEVEPTPKKAAPAH
ncbi:hypothetical protein N7L95_12585 [Eleftheria terrae]|nr:hypothetical protein [Eleftheria terrae]WKB55148.1 hypothetical protein N7L95_12585 [Eleftheria terrae]